MADLTKGGKVCCFASLLTVPMLLRAFNNSDANRLKIICASPAQYASFQILRDFYCDKLPHPDLQAILSIPILKRNTLAPGILEAWEFDGVETHLLCTLTDLALPLTFSE